MTTSTHRSPIAASTSNRSRGRAAAVGAACQELVERVQADASDPDRMKLALAVVSLVTGWTRLEGEVQVAEIAALIGRSDRFTRAKLLGLSADGLIVWRPTRGRGARSIVGLPRPTAGVGSAAAQSRARAAAAPDLGYLYLIQFDNGVIKAGRTVDVDVRRGEHERAAGRLDVRIVRTWTSEVNDAPASESRLLRLLDKVAQRTPAGREYFRNVPFTIAQSLATGDGLSIDDVPCCCGTCIGAIELTLPATAVGTAARRDDDAVPVAQFQFRCGGRITGLLQDPDLSSGGAYPLRLGQKVILTFTPPATPAVDGRTRPWIVWSAAPAPADGPANSGMHE